MVKNIVISQVESLGRETIEFNCSIFRGEGTLGNTYFRALSLASPYGGVHYIEALVDTMSGRIVEILLPNPKRVYEKEVVSITGKRTTVPVALSEQHPSARLAVLLVSSKSGNEIVDLIARDEIAPEARACLHESIRESRVAPLRQKVA